MIPKTFFYAVALILYQQIIFSKASWDVKRALIMNLKNNEISFPRHVGESNGSSISYIEPGEEQTTRTYYFCMRNMGFVLVNNLEGRPLEHPYPTCPEELGLQRDYIVDKEGKPVHCGTTKKLNGYQYHYYNTLYIENVGEFTKTLYEYCYDEAGLEILYAKYTLDNPRLLENKLLADEQSFKFHITQSLKETFDPQEAYFKDQYDYVPRMVGIPEFAPFGHWRKSLYQWHNVAPMNKDLIEPWELLLQNLRSNLASKTHPIKVYSGVYEKLRVNGLVQHPSRGKMPVPKFWWVLLYNEDESQGVSVIMHNYSYDYDDKKHTPLCDKDISQDVGLRNVIPTAYPQAYIYCCSASTIADKYSFPEVKQDLVFKEKRTIEVGTQFDGSDTEASESKRRRKEAS